MTPLAASAQKVQAAKGPKADTAVVNQISKKYQEAVKKGSMAEAKLSFLLRMPAKLDGAATDYLKIGDYMVLSPEEQNSLFNQAKNSPDGMSSTSIRRFVVGYNVSGTTNAPDMIYLLEKIYPEKQQ